MKVPTLVRLLVPFAIVSTGFLAGSAEASANCTEGWQQSLGQPGFSSDVRAITSFDGTLIAAGSFSSSGDTPLSRVAYWDGGQWLPLGDGLNGTVHDLLVHEGTLYACGDGLFGAVGAVAIWTNNSWQQFGHGFDGTVRRILAFNDQLMAAGSFTAAGSTTADGVATWDDDHWTPVIGMSTSIAHDADVRDMTLWSNQIVVVGSFSLNGDSGSNVASWDGTEWTGLASTTNGPVHACTTWNDRLVVVGGFNSIDGVLVRKVAVWDQGWSGFGPGINQEGCCDAVHSVHNHSGTLYIGGNFWGAGPVEVNHIAQWNPSLHLWLPLGSGMNGIVRRIYSRSSSELIAGGGFLVAGGSSSKRISAWHTCEVIPPVPGDLNGDSSVDLLDLLILLSAWGPCPDCTADLNDDGIVNQSDLFILLGFWTNV